MFYSGQGGKKNLAKAREMCLKLQSANTACKSIAIQGDDIIDNVLPPSYALTIEEGSCGECCIWTLANAHKPKGVTQIDINKAGGAPGRGLRSNELGPAMKKFGIRYKLIGQTFDHLSGDKAARQYKEFLYKDVIGAVKQGHPVLLGVKSYPTRFPQWPYDHFILAVGHNDTTGEIICNDFARRRRLSAAQLVTQRENGYSLLNDFNIVFAMEILEY